MQKSSLKKLMIVGLGAVALGALFTREAFADNPPTPDATWDSLFVSDEDTDWNSLIFNYGNTAGLGGDSGGGIVIKGGGGLIVGIPPPPISPWMP